MSLLAIIDHTFSGYEIAAIIFAFFAGIALIVRADK